MAQSHPVPSLVDRANRWIRLLTQQSPSRSIHPDAQTSAGLFSNAHDFAINGGQFINELKVNYINDVVSNRQAVFELLEPHTCLDATKDSSARYPPPKCHPQTRLKIRKRLSRWLSSNEKEPKMLWVRGSAGTGKSAVAQSFGDSCEEEHNFGASYFFSKVANRNKLKTVVPTLVYQLAESVPEYCSLIGNRLAESPLLLRKSPPVQFRELILKPFMALQHQRSRKPIAIILDGLDECESEDAQLEIIEMITNVVQSNPDLPLRWLIFSRPEAHLKNVFSRNMLCGREELIIDAECWEDVERYVKGRLAKIKTVYKDITPAEWPLQNELNDLLDAVSGLFILASTCISFIADPDVADPPSSLNSLLMFMRRSQGVMSRNPLAALDLLYYRILEKIPPLVFDKTRQILAYVAHRPKLDYFRRLDSVQLLSNFLRLDQHTFYKAVHGVHSVMSIPEPEQAGECQLQFYHASFHDFLLDPNRSGKFFIGEQDAVSNLVELVVHWCDIDATYFHAHDGWDFDIHHNHHILPGLAWVSEDEGLFVSQLITEFIEYDLFHTGSSAKLDLVNDRLLAQLSDTDFRYWHKWNIFFLTQLFRLDSITSVVRTELSGPMDHQLLEYFNLVIGNGVAKPALLPLRNAFPASQWIREYFFIGHGAKSVIVWTTRSGYSTFPEPFFLRGDREPSETQKSQYANYLREIRWDEEAAKLAMEYV